MHPAAGHHILEFNRGRLRIQELRERHQFQTRVLGERRVQALEKIVAVEGKMLPGILPIEGNKGEMPGLVGVFRATRSSSATKWRTASSPCHFE